MVEHPPVLLLLFLSLVDGDRGEGAMGVSSDTHLSKKFKMFEEYFGIIFKFTSGHQMRPVWSAGRGFFLSGGRGGRAPHGC